MVKTEFQEKIESLGNNYSKLNTLERVQLFEEITRAISEHVTFENKNRDSTDGIFDVLSKIADSVQEDFEELVGISSNKKHFIRALTKIFTLLLNTKVDTVEKIKKILKIAIDTTLKIWQEPKPPRDECL